MARDNPIRDSYTEAQLKAILTDHQNMEQSYPALYRLFHMVWSDVREMAQLVSDTLEETSSIEVPVTRKQLGLDRNDLVSLLYLYNIITYATFSTFPSITRSIGTLPVSFAKMQRSTWDF